MANIIITHRTQLNAAVVTESLPGLLYAGENDAHVFIISAVRGDTPVTLSGAVTGLFIRPDESTVALDGEIVNGCASVTLPQSCYTQTGRFQLTVFVTENDVKTAVYCLTGNVKKTSTETIIDPGHVVPDISDIIAEYATMQQAVEDCEDAAEAANTAATAADAAAAGVAGAIADAYSASSTYAVGDYCTKDGKLYRCVSAISTAEAWTAAHWTEVQTMEEVGDLKSQIDGMTTATAEDAGKALKAKTVTDGKVTEWEFGAAGGEEYQTKEWLLNPSITANTNTNNVTDNEDGTFTIGTTTYGTTEFASPISLLPGEYTLFGTPNGFTYISTTSTGYSNPVAVNNTDVPKKVTISVIGLYYIGIRINNNQKPSAPITITPSLISEEDISVHKDDIYENADILTDKTIGQYTTNTAVTDNQDGTFTIGTSNWGTLMVGAKMTLDAGIYELYVSPNSNGFSFVTENTTVTNAGNDCIAANKTTHAMYFEITEQKQVYIGFRNMAKPSAAYTISPYLLTQRAKFVESSVLDSFKTEVEGTIEEVVAEVDSVVEKCNAFNVQIVENIGYNLYADGSGNLVGPSADTKRAYTTIDTIPAKAVTLTIASGIRVYVYERINGYFWKRTGDSWTATNYTHIFDPDADLYFFQYSSGSDIPTGATLVTVVCDTTAQRAIPTAKQRIFDTYRNRATILRQQRTGSESNGTCIFKAMLVSDVHVAEGRMADVIKVISDWGDSYFDALINCGDTLNQGTDSIEWYNTLISDLSIPHFNAVGNHDVVNTTAETTYNKIIAPVAAQTGVVQPTDASTLYLDYYYYDFTNIRLIVLDPTNWTADQAAWLETALAGAKTNSKAVICASHYGFASQYTTVLACNWAFGSNASAATNIVAAEKVKAFIDDGGTFICWLVGHEHADNLHVLSDYDHQLVITLPGMTTRATALYPNTDADAYNYDVMTYFTVDSYDHTIRLMRMGADIDMRGVQHSGVALNYSTGALIGSW